nr:hypothetical protein [uncultured Selenomonas sp.]
MSDSNRIIKNTMFLYFRMFCVMGVSFYTVRIVLVALGIEDYGIYQTIVGIVGMVSFLNEALSTGSTRFLTFELGKGRSKRLNQTFSTLLIAHFLIAVVVVIVAEMFAWWFLGMHLNTSETQFTTAMIVFQLSVLTAIMSMTQIPYTAVIIAHEKLGIYAYVAVAEVALKLGIAFVLTEIATYRLEFYALLMCLVQVFIMALYRWFCYRYYPESHWKLSDFNFDVLRPVITFSGWSIFAQVSMALMNQGTLLLLSIFFSPAIVAARVIALQVTNTAQQFLGHFRTAVTPQVVKRVAAGDFAGSKNLLLKSVYFSYYLVFMIAFPIILLAEPLLNLWLHEVPDYAVIFLQWSMIQSLFAVFDSSLYTALYAKGQLRENALLSPMVGFVIMPLQLILFQQGCSPLITSYLLTFTYALLGLVIKPYLVCKVVGYDWKSVLRTFQRCIIVTLVSVPLIWGSVTFLDRNTLLGFIETCFVSVIVSLPIIWWLGLDQYDREKIWSVISVKLGICKNIRGNGS